MQVQGVHGVAKPLLVSPTQQAAIAKQLDVVPSQNPGLDLSNAIRAERQRSYRVIRDATEKHWRRKRLRTVKFDEEVRFTIVGGGRERVEVEGQGELVAIDGEFLVEPTRDSRIDITPPVALTFADGPRRQNFQDDDAVARARERAEREVAIDTQCECFQRNELFNLRGPCHVDGYDVDFEKAVRDLSPPHGDIPRRGDFVRVKQGVIPTLGWCGGCNGDVNHASIGVVTDVTGAVATVCFSTTLRQWRAAAIDLEVVLPPSQQQQGKSRGTTCDGDYDAEQHDRAYIFEAHQDQAAYDSARGIIQESALLLMEDERLSRRDRLVGSTFAAHVALVDGDSSYLERWKTTVQDDPPLSATCLCLCGSSPPRQDPPSDFTDLFF